MFRSPIIILAVYISVALGGYYTCGTECPEIIILRKSAEGDKTDILMNICRFGLLVCLVVGIIIRNQSNKAAIFGIVDQFKKIKEDGGCRRTPGVCGAAVGRFLTGQRETAEMTDRIFPTKNAASAAFFFIIPR